MTDNTTLNTGSGGDVIAADDIGPGVKYQRVKLVEGADGTNDGDISSANPLPVEIKGSLVGTNGPCKAEDVASADADIGIPAMAVRKATAANTSGTDGDYEFLQMSAGRLWASATIDAALPAGSSTIGKVDLNVSTTGPAKAEDVASGDGDIGIPAYAVRKATPANTSGTDGDYEPLQVNNGALWVSPLGFPVSVESTIVLPTSSVYAINDALSDSTSAPTVGGYTFTSAARKSGGSGIITDAIITTSADQGTLLQGEVWIFNQAVTAINDNAVFAVSDAEIRTVVAKIPFTFEDAGNNGFAHVQNLSILFTCVGTANLRWLLKAKNAYTPATDTIAVTLKILQID